MHKNDIKISKKQLEQLFVSGYKYSKVGITLSRLCNDENRQLDLFESKQTMRNEKLMKTLDNINSKGLGRVYLAAQGVGQSWQMNRNLMSPSYRSSWNELPKIR